MPFFSVLMLYIQRENGESSCDASSLPRFRLARMCDVSRPPTRTACIAPVFALGTWVARFPASSMVCADGPQNRACLPEWRLLEKMQRRLFGGLRLRVALLSLCRRA